MSQMVKTFENIDPSKILPLINGRVSKVRVGSGGNIIIIEDDNLNRLTALFLELCNMDKAGEGNNGYAKNAHSGTSCI